MSSFPPLQSELNGTPHQFLIEPVSATVCFRHQLSPSPLRSLSSPRLAFHITMPSFPLYLNDVQFSQMVNILLFLML